MKSHMLFLQCVLNDMGTRCCTSTSRDFNTIAARVEKEGLSFLTITLPQFAKDLEQALDEGKVAPSHFASFAKRGCLPKFLSGFTSLIFEATSGCLLDDPSITAIHAVRQISNLFGKVDLPCSQAREKAAIEKFIECEQHLKDADANLNPAYLWQAQRIARLLFMEDIFVAIDRDIYNNDIFPKHGPGATADKLRGNAKWNQQEWTERLDEIFDHSIYLYPSFSHFCESRPIKVLDPGQERPVKVTLVPKTLKTPRIIAIEPTCMQYMQQGIMLRLVELIERSDSLSTFIGFRDQIPNQEMARRGSIDGSLATLDLSEASDRVSNQLVRYLFCSAPWFSKALDATRSRKADVPGKGVIRLAKYASMGSALCFPIEAMVFTTLVFLGIERERRHPLTHADLKRLRGVVRVYGDDIIVPVEYVRSVVSTLQDFGLVVNESKSFWTGKFRESCGKEYYDGFDVSTVKVRRMLPTSRRHVPEIISTVSLRNQLCADGFDTAVEMLDSQIERFIPFPFVRPTSRLLGKHSLDGRYDVDRMCPFLQRPLVRGAVVTGQNPPSHLEGPGALLKWFLKQGDKPFADRNHLERAGRPEAVNIKLRLASPL